MAINLSTKDHAKLDQLIKQVLDWHKNGSISDSQALGVIAHVFTAAAIDNEGEVHSWLHDPEVLKRWRGDIGNA
jgi:hypothetical protein